MEGMGRRACIQLQLLRGEGAVRGAALRREALQHRLEVLTGRGAHTAGLFHLFLATWSFIYHRQGYLCVSVRSKTSTFSAVTANLFENEC